MSEMTLRQALSIATDCIEHRAEQWREAATGIYMSTCFVEADEDECNAIAQDQEHALEVMLHLVANLAALNRLFDPEVTEITGVAAYQKEYPNMQRIKNINDHQLAKLLRENGAIDNFTHAGNTCRWFDKNERLVAIAFYDNSKCIRQVFLPDYIKYEEDSNNETK